MSRFTSYLRSAGLRQYAVPLAAVLVAALLRMRLDGLAVLLVEDHTDSRETIALTLESFGAEVASVPTRLPAVALTAYASAEDRERALAAGYDAHVPKPVDADELGAALARLAPRSRV